LGKTNVPYKYNITVHPSLYNFRNVLIITLVDAFTCLFAGFAIFSILGYLAHNQGADVTDVIQEGEFQHDLL